VVVVAFFLAFACSGVSAESRAMVRRINRQQLTGGPPPPAGAPKPPQPAGAGGAQKPGPPGAAGAPANKQNKNAGETYKNSLPTELKGEAIYNMELSPVVPKFLQMQS